MESRVVESKAVDRLTIFTDGVMAISITLLVLDIRVPEGAGEMTSAELFDALLDLWPGYLTYILSFLVIGTFWRSHFEKFRWLRGVNGGLIRLNIMFLLTIGIVPFVTDVLSDNGGEVATILYAAVMALSAALLVALWGYAWRAGLIDPQLPPDVIRGRLIRGTMTPLVFLLSIPVALVDAQIAKLVWLLLIPLGLERRINGPAVPAAFEPAPAVAPASGAEAGTGDRGT